MVGKITRGNRSSSDAGQLNYQCVFITDTLVSQARDPIMHMVDPHSQIKTKSLQNRSLRTGIPPPAPPTMQSNAQQPSLEQQERTLSYEEKAPPKAPSDTEKAIASSSSSIHEEEEKKPSFSERYKHFIRAGLAIVILGWWISSTVLPATRPRWFVTSRRLSVLFCSHCEK